MACAPVASTSGSGATQDGGASDSGTGTTKTLSCTGVLQCAEPCPGVDACAKACVDRARPSSSERANALLQCLTDNACKDPTCTDSKCGGELDACLADVSEQGTPSTGPAPTGAVPANLVGTWSSVGTSSGTVWTFEADGKTVTAFELDTSLGSCTYKTSVTTSGVTAATASTFTYHRETGTQVLKKCGSTSSSALPAVDANYRYEIGKYDDGTPKLTIHFVSDDGTVSSGTELHH